MTTPETPPVAIFGFNRPDCLVHVFKKVREARPGKLFLIMDAPRANRPDDIPGWEACKRIFEGVDWPCEVQKNYAESNMGCRGRISSGIGWALAHVESVIILEDDCVPDLTFFRFCAELLHRYRDDTRVGAIYGTVEHLLPMAPHAESYYFSRMATCIGWATWRRAWNLMDIEMREWPRFKANNGLDIVCRTEYQKRCFSDKFDRVFEGSLGSWAYAWFLTVFRNNLLLIRPYQNLVTNIGFGVGATHTANPDSPWAQLQITPMVFPLTHPADIVPNLVEEQKTITSYHALKPALWFRMAIRLKKLLHMQQLTQHGKFVPLKRMLLKHVRGY